MNFIKSSVNGLYTDFATVIPYQEPAAKEGAIGDMLSTVITSLPMAAMFTRNKYIAWTAIVMAVQNWLSESPEQRAVASQPAYMTVGMASMLPLLNQP